jgi:GMP synthase-like glutamine amidotransferase
MLNKIGLVDCGSPKIPELKEILRPECESLQTVKLAEAAEADWGGVKALVISGGPGLFTAEDKGPVLREQISFLAGLSMPMLGICLGHQALGLIHGAEVFRGAECREPMQIELTGEHPLFESIASPALFSEDHCEGINLPTDFTLLASSKHYPVEAMAHDGLKRYGVQFHPEISGDIGQRLFANFLKLVV